MCVGAENMGYFLIIPFRLAQLPGGGGRESQRLMGYARLLAEMYNYAVVGSPTVFETLHLLLNSGHEVYGKIPYPGCFDVRGLLASCRQESRSSKLEVCDSTGGWWRDVLVCKLDVDAETDHRFYTSLDCTSSLSFFR